MSFFKPEIIFIIIGMILFIAGIVPFTLERSNLQRYKAEGSYTLGIISDIQSFRSGNNTQNYVYVDFTSEGGESITVKLNFYSSSMYIGKPIGIYYNPQNPHDYVAEGSTGIILLSIFGGIGLIFILTGFVVHIKQAKLFKKQKMAMEKNIV